MKILLIKPDYGSHVITPPLGLGYIASVLEMDGHDVHIVDLATDHLSDDGFLRTVKKREPDLIGFSLMSDVKVLSKVREIITNLRRVSEAPIVIGGPQVSSLPAFTLQYTRANFAVIGEGENTMKELARALDKESGEEFDSIRGLAFLEGNGNVRINEPRELIKNLDQIPFPAWHLMPPSKYRISPVLASVKRQPVAPIITSRGCPFLCTFCAGHVTWGRTFRVRSPKNVVDEIEMLVEKYGVREIQISDDNFTLIRKHAFEVCREIIRRKIDIYWSCPNGVRADKLDRELLYTMKLAGCHLFGFGIESGNQKTLHRIKKRLDLEVVSKAVKTAKDLGITTVGFFILGLPGENFQDIQRTINFAKNIPLDRAWFSTLNLLPGAELFWDFLKDDNIAEIDIDKLNVILSGAGTSNLTKNALKKAQKLALMKFYLEPTRLLKLLRSTGIQQLRTFMIARKIVL